ncbi:MAG: NTP transferase domain-containing protein [Desulfopila sp.]
MMDSGKSSFSAIVLAADREHGNPVAATAGVRCKSLAPVEGVPMLFRVLTALEESGQIDDILLCGPPEAVVAEDRALSEAIATGRARWIANRQTPSLSTLAAIDVQPVARPLLVTTSDHALLSPPMVQHFCDQAVLSGCDVVAAVASHQTVTSSYPQTTRTAYRFRDGAYCSCNLFAFLTPDSRCVPAFWRRVERQRKNPLRVVATLGWLTVLRYLLGRLTLAEVMDQLSQRLGCRAGVVEMPFAEAAIDVDTPADYRFVEEILAGRVTTR